MRKKGKRKHLSLEIRRKRGKINKIKGEEFLHLVTKEREMGEKLFYFYILIMQREG